MPLITISLSCVSDDLSLFCKINFFNPCPPPCNIAKVTSKDCLGNFQGKYKDLFHYVSKKIAETLLKQLLTSHSAGNGRFWQQNVIQDRKSFITQSKLMIFWWNKKFLKAYDLLLLSPEKKWTWFWAWPLLA